MKRQYTYMPFHCNTVLTVFSGDAQNCEHLVDVLAFPQSNLDTTRMYPSTLGCVLVSSAASTRARSSTATAEVLPSPNGSLRSTADTGCQSMATRRLISH